MRWTIFLMCFLVGACSRSNTDALEPHEIVNSPAHNWVRWDQDAPLDVTQEKVKTKQVCPRRRED